MTVDMLDAWTDAWCHLESCFLQAPRQLLRRRPYYTADVHPCDVHVHQHQLQRHAADGREYRSARVHAGGKEHVATQTTILLMCAS